MLSEGDGLRALQMGVPAHYGALVFLRLVGDGGDEVQDLALDFRSHAPCKQLHIQSHLVVAAAGGVQLFAHRADASDEGLLHKGMDILGALVDHDLTFFQIGKDVPERGDQQLHILGGDDALLAQHRGVRNRTRDILFNEFFVKGDRGIECFRRRIDVACGASCPKFTHTYFLTFAFTIACTLVGSP